MPDTVPPQRPGILKQDSNGPPAECASPSSYLGLSYAQSPRGTAQSPRGTPKSVSIASKTEAISPLVLGKQKNVDDFNLESQKGPRRPSVKGPAAHRLSGRPGINPVQSNTSLDGASQSDDRGFGEQLHSKHVDHLVDEISNWIRSEREKRAARKASKKHRKHVSRHDHASSTAAERRGSNSSEDSLDLQRLEEILKKSSLGEGSSSRKHSLRHKISLKKLHKRKPSSGATSDTEYLDGDAVVPACDAILDNSKTVAQTVGVSESDESSDELHPSASYRDFDAWASFKFEIVRLTHTLRLKGWRRIPMEICNQITVERLSGALTNAVYVVSPPEELPAKAAKEEKSDAPQPQKVPPKKLLLRIYGPQVEHLIDRESELAILKRLARKRIGPRLLGTFQNGRFEEYLHAKPLSYEEMRNPETSRQIAKRMRELHDGIDLTDKERNDGPFVWLNWDKWVDRVEQIVTWMDRQIDAMDPDVKPAGDEVWKRRGYICGVPWARFREAVDKYRAWLEIQYGGASHVSEELVFAHNDTQYGNILRMVPSGESPLLLPQNSHKQLVVIDFEYSNANLPGLEFANHFTEWCYNYHSEKKPYACDTRSYPTPEDQDRFLRAYVRHRPQFNVSTPKMQPSSPSMSGNTRRTTSSISTFMLDARKPHAPSQPAQHDENAEISAEDAEVKRLMKETRLWRLANTAQWVAWGIVQAKIPGMPMFSPGKAEDPESSPFEEPGTDDAGAREDLGERADEYKELIRQQTADSENNEAEEEHEEFDYLGYAQHRAMFFWGDMLQMGLVKEDELPADMREKIKVVPY